MLTWSKFFFLALATNAWHSTLFITLKLLYSIVAKFGKINKKLKKVNISSRSTVNHRGATPKCLGGPNFNWQSVIWNKVHEVRANNKVRKVRSSQLFNTDSAYIFQLQEHFQPDPDRLPFDLVTGSGGHDPNHKFRQTPAHRYARLSRIWRQGSSVPVPSPNPKYRCGFLL